VQTCGVVKVCVGRLVVLVHNQHLHHEWDGQQHLDQIHVHEVSEHRELQHLPGTAVDEVLRYHFEHVFGVQVEVVSLLLLVCIRTVYRHFVRLYQLLDLLRQQHVVIATVLQLKQRCVRL